MLGFWLGMYYGCVLGFLGAITYRHWTSLYEPRTFIHEEPEVARTKTLRWRFSENDTWATIDKE